MDVHCLDIGPGIGQRGRTCLFFRTRIVPLKS